MTDAWIAPVWLGITLLLIYSAWTAAQRLFAEESIFAQLRHTIVLSWAMLVTASLSLGICQFLYPPALLIAVAALSAALLGVVKIGLPDSGPDRLLALPLARGSDRVDARETAWHWLWLGLFALGFSEIVCNGLLTFPASWDSLNYHLPIIDQWLRSHSLSATDQSTWFVPGNNELLGLWLVAPFSGDFLVRLINLPSAVLLAVSAVDLGRRVGLSLFFRHVGPLAILASVPVMRQLLDPKNDMAVCALFMATLCYGSSWLGSGRGSDLALAGVSLGLLAGVKYYAVGYGGLAWGALVLAAWKWRGGRDAWRMAVTLALVTVCLGGYWYARNTWLTGAPFYPKGFTQKSDLVGEMRSQATNMWQTTLLGNGNPTVFYLLLKALWTMAGPCQWLAFVLLPCTFAWMLGSGFWLVRHHDDARGGPRLMLGLGLLATGLTWGFTPFGAEVAPGTLDMLRGGYLPARFGFCFLSFALLGLLLLLQDGLALFEQPLTSKDLHAIARTRFSLGLWCLAQVLCAALAAAVLWQLFYFLLRETKAQLIIESLLLAANLLLAILLLAVVWRAWPGVRLAVGAGGVGLALSTAFAAVSWLAPHWHAGFSPFYDRLYQGQLFVRLERMDPKTTRLCVLDYRIYPFLGSQRQFRVSQPMWLPSFAHLIEFLHEHDATVVVVKASDTQGVRRYDGKLEWLQEHPELFQLIYQDSAYFFFQINQRSLEKAFANR